MLLLYRLLRGEQRVVFVFVQEQYQQWPFLRLACGAERCFFWAARSPSTGRGLHLAVMSWYEQYRGLSGVFYSRLVSNWPPHCCCLMSLLSECVYLYKVIIVKSGFGIPCVWRSGWCRPHLARSTMRDFDFLRTPFQITTLNYHGARHHGLCSSRRRALSNSNEEDTPGMDE